MKRRTLTALAVLLMAVAGCGKRSPAATRPFLAVLQAAENGWNAGDLEAYMRAYEQSDDLSFAGTDGVSYGWHQVLSNYREAYPGQLAMGHLAFNDLKVTRLGEDAALVVGRWRLDRLQDQPHGVLQPGDAARTGGLAHRA